MNYKNILVLDIGTSSVNGFYVRVSQGQPAEVIFSSRSTLKLLENPDFKSMWRYVKAALETSFALLEKGGRLRPDFIFIVLSSPWYLSQTRIIRVERPESFEVSEKLVEELIREELELFRKKSEKQLVLPASELSVLERNVMAAVLNGYPVVSPFNKKTRQLELFLYTSISRKELLEELNNLLVHRFGSGPIKMNSSPLVLFRILKEIYNPEEGFLIVDVGGEITEIALIRRRFIEEVATFARGGNFMVRRLASVLGVGLDEAFSLLRAKTRGELKNSMDAKVSEVLDQAAKSWFELFSSALEGIAKENLLPPNAVLLGGASGLEILKTYIQSPELSRFTFLGQPFKAATLLPDTLGARVGVLKFDQKDPQLTLPLLLVLAASRYAFEF